ncbi:hypothetical protein KBC75_04200 [Candidatus Shapirobacteria bacterium]|nr:hypothetical protein [Candidatus Shapirobacteria bacterium]
MSRTQKIIFSLVFVVCLAVQILPVVRSGLTYQYGIGFWGPNGHDGIWHLSLINNLDNPLKISLPPMAGENLSNYHPFFDILISLLVQTTHIPGNLWLFQIFPVVSTIIFLWLSFQVARKITGKFSGGIYFMCLNSFANSLGWLITLVRGQGLGGESLFWAMQSASNQINPPYLLSIIFILWLIYLLPPKVSRLSISSAIQIFTILSLLPITKAYAIVPGLLIFGIYSLNAYFKKIYQPAIILILSFFSLLLVFQYYNPNSSGLLSLSPFWFTKSLVESVDRLYLPKIANQLHLLFSFSPTTFFKLFFAYSLSFLLFIIGNFSFRLIGFYKLDIKKSWTNQALLISIVVLILIPTLFIQKGTAWNTIQFVYYALFLGNLLLAKQLIALPRLAILVLLINFISNYSSFQNSLGNPPPAYISTAETSALNFLQQLPPGTVLTVPYDKYLKNSFTSTPIPLYAYETTSYVSAYSQHPTFVDDYMNLANSGYNYQDRLRDSLQFFKQENIFSDRGFLLNNHLEYIYLTGLQKNKLSLNINNLYLTKVYENSESIIYQVQK